MTEKPLILSSEIPWQELKAKELEELLYWLLDSMGARDLEWRIGGSGGGAADQGRDLECTFQMSAPDGEFLRQKWWVEAKGRKKTVEPSDVKEAVLNAAGKTHIDVLLVVTNSHFSNATRDWVKEFQKGHARPVIKLWERTELEKHCSSHPLAVIRLFGKALSLDGKLEVVRSRFWNNAAFADEAMLSALWKARGTFELTAEQLLALTISECAIGDVSRRAWPCLADDLILVTTLMNYLMNVFFFIHRAEEGGGEQRPFIDAGAYLALCSLDRLGLEQTTRILEDWSFDERKWPEQIRQYILGPVLSSLVSDVRDVCTDDCERVMTEPYNLTKPQIENYWHRLHVRDAEVEEKDKRYLSLEKLDGACKVGFCVNKDNGCPVNGNTEPELRVAETLVEIDQIIRFRKQIALAAVTK